jgi:hypothetical protein
MTAEAFVYKTLLSCACGSPERNVAGKLALTANQTRSTVTRSVLRWLGSRMLQWQH